MAVPVVVEGGFVAGGTITVAPFVVPGIVAGAAYTAGDAMGTIFQLDLQGAYSGIIHTVNCIDLDKEQLEFDIVLFDDLFKPTADNAAFDVGDVDAQHIVGIITLAASDFKAFNDNAAACVKNLGCSFVAPKGKLWGQLVTRGAPNYTAATDLLLGFAILVD